MTTSALTFTSFKSGHWWDAFCGAVPFPDGSDPIAAHGNSPDDDDKEWILIAHAKGAYLILNGGETEYILEHQFASPDVVHEFFSGRDCTSLYGDFLMGFEVV